MPPIKVNNSSDDNHSRSAGDKRVAANGAGTGVAEVGGGFMDLVTTPLRRTLSGYLRKGSGNAGGSSSGGGSSSSRNNSLGSASLHSGIANGIDKSANGARSTFLATPSKGSRSANGRFYKCNGSGSNGVRRPADGRAPGRRDPEAVARQEAAAKLAAAEGDREGVDRSWQLPTNVDYYTDRGELLNCVYVYAKRECAR